MREKRSQTTVYRLQANRSGQTLIEVIIAFAVVVFISVGLVTAGLATQKASLSARNEAQATKLAQEYVEKLRAMRDAKGWKNFILGLGNNPYRINVSAGADDITKWTLTAVGSGSSPCNQAASTPMHGEVVPVDDVNFCRKATILGYTSGADTMTFNISVGWMEGQNVKNTTAMTVLSKWCAAVIDPTQTDACLDQ